MYSLLGVQSVADVVRRGRLRWFGHLEQRSVDDWVSACRKVDVVRCEGSKRKTWKKCVDKDMEKCLVYTLNVWRDLIWANV